MRGQRAKGRSQPVLPGPYIARVDPATGKQIWRTFLENANVTGNWIGVSNLNILADGTMVRGVVEQVVCLTPGPAVSCGPRRCRPVRRRRGTGTSSTSPWPRTGAFDLEESQTRAAGIADQHPGDAQGPPARA